MAANESQLSEDESRREVATTDLLCEIIKELKITNFHLSLLTDQVIDKEEIP